MKKGFTVFYSAFLLLLTVAGATVAFYFAVKQGETQGVLTIVGVALSLAFAPIAHELGHVFFAKKNGMKVVYVKGFCFRFQAVEGKKRLSLASPFSPDETQIVPRSSGNMKKRALHYALGGLIFSGAFCLVILALALILSACEVNAYLPWGMLPYSAYLFLLNAAPLVYPSGKTDALVAKNLRTGEDDARAFLSAMEIQGGLYEGKSFDEIDENLYFDFPQLCEDEPLFAVTLDLRYRLYLERNELEKASDCLNRMAGAQPYLSETEEEKLAAELVYMHALHGDFEGAEACGKSCMSFLKSESVAAKRVLAAYTTAFGEREAAEILIAQAYAAAEKEENSGYAKAEKILISRLKTRIKDEK